MSVPWVALVVIAALVPVLGLVLLVVGLRGRLADSLAYCRRCRFCLEGLAHTTCPECGRDLAPARAIRVGRRRARKGFVAVGGVLVLIALIGGGVLGWGAATAFNWNTIKPVWLLEMDAGSANRGTASGAWGELAGRLTADGLDDATGERLAEAAIGLQRDVDHPWSPEIGDFIEAAHAKGHLSDQQWYAYYQSAVSLTADVRPRIRAGAAIPYQIGISSGRIGPNSSLVLRVGAMTLRSSDGRVLAARDAGGFSGLGRGGSSRLAGSNPTDLPIGEYAGQIELGLGLHAGYDENALHSWSMSFPFEFAITPEESVVLAAPVGPSVDDSVRAAFSVGRLGVESVTDGVAQLYFELRATNLPVDCSFDIFAVVDSQEVHAGTVNLSATGGQSSHGMGLRIPGLRTDQVTLILRASVAPAEHTVGMTSIWDGEVVLRDQAVGWPERVVRPEAGAARPAPDTGP